MIYTLTLNPGLDKEYTVPFIQHNQVLRTSSIRTDIGGKGFNISRMLNKLGCQSIALGFVGGFTGKLLREGLEKLGIATDLIETADESRTNTSIVDEQGNHYIKVNEPGPHISTSELTRLSGKVSDLAKPGDWWILSGSLPRGVPEHFYAHVIEVISEKGAYAVLDTSANPLRLGCRAHPFLIKPNLFEAGELAGVKADNLHQSYKLVPILHKFGAQNIVISAGDTGALLSNGSTIWLGKPPFVQELNPIGAGDAMLAGMIKSMACGETIEQAFALGIACGAAAASLPGTGMPDKEYVEDVLKQVKVKKI